jgi:hypothetical protein
MATRLDPFQYSAKSMALGEIQSSLRTFPRISTLKVAPWSVASLVLQ